MERVIPWARLEALIEPAYPKGGRVGRQPIGVSRMLWMFLLQQWFGLADEAVEDKIYDSQAMRDFVGIDLARGAVPDATTLLKFRRLLEQHALTAQLFAGINAHLRARPPAARWHDGGCDHHRGPALYEEQRSRARPRDAPDQKGNEWHFGIKADIGADAASGLVHSLHATAANESDVAHAHAVLHRQEMVAFLDAGYTGVAKRAEVVQAQKTARFTRTSSGTWPSGAAR